ncbi:MAG: ankyrin repeat domain-containing protein [Holosporales bacterium]|jgi:hypothetical protein|nr:ankyrin repeat domain-containing protein [Holosporales bacterium]
MKEFYKTTALLVSLLGISNISYGAAGDARAIHETEGIGQAILHPIERVGELWKNGKDSFKEHPGKWIIGGAIVAAVGISKIIWNITRPAPPVPAPAPAVVPVPAAPPAPVPALALVPAPAPLLLHEAIQEGRINDAKTLLKNGADKEAKDNDGETPLHVAAWKGSIEIVKVLLAAGANKEGKDYYGMTPLYGAIICATKGHTECTKVLLAAGARKDVKDKWKRTPRDLVVPVKRAPRDLAYFAAVKRLLA